MGTLKNILKRIPLIKELIKVYDALQSASKSYPWMVHNIKQMAVELANQQQTKSARSGGKLDNCPQKIELKSKICLQEDLESIEYAYWLDQLKINFIYHRKLWELAYVCQVVWQNGLLGPDKRGLGFAVGDESLPSYFAAHNVKIHATDAPPQLSTGWVETGQYASNMEAVYKSHLVSRETFDKNVSFEAVDMNHIPEHLRDFDFCWSICSLEHLGSIQLGLDFIENSLKTLKSGGYSIHTAEYNVSSNDRTLDHGSTVLFRQQDIERIADKLTRLGHEVIPLDFSYGTLPLDLYIDFPPYSNVSPHLKLSIQEFTCTSIGFVVRKK